MMTTGEVWTFLAAALLWPPLVGPFEKAMAAMLSVVQIPVLRRLLDLLGLGHRLLHEVRLGRGGHAEEFNGRGRWSGPRERVRMQAAPRGSPASARAPAGTPHADLLDQRGLRRLPSARLRRPRGGADGVPLGAARTQEEQRRRQGGSERGGHGGTEDMYGRSYGAMGGPQVRACVVTEGL